MQGQDKDYQWFQEHYNDLFSKYGNSFLAIKGEEVIGVYQSFAEGVCATQKTEELGSFIVQQCNGNESGYTNYIASMNFM